MIAPLILAGIGAGLGALSGGGGNQSQTTSMDQASQDYITRMRAIAQMFAGRGMPDMDPAFLAAMTGMQGYAGAGAQGLQALLDPATMARLFTNPAAQGMGANFDYQRAQAENQYRKSAAGAGAFGVRGQMLGPQSAYDAINRNQNEFNFNNAMQSRQAAFQLAGMGMPANQWLGDMGNMLTNRQRNWDMGSLAMLSQGFGQPLSTTTGGKMDRGNIWQRMAGGALTGLSFAKPGAAPGAPTPSAAYGPSSGIYSGGYPGANLPYGHPAYTAGDPFGQYAGY